MPQWFSKGAFSEGQSGVQEGQPLTPPRVRAAGQRLGPLRLSRASTTPHPCCQGPATLHPWPVPTYPCSINLATPHTHPQHPSPCCHPSLLWLTLIPVPSPGPYFPFLWVHTGPLQGSDSFQRIGPPQVLSQLAPISPWGPSLSLALPRLFSSPPFSHLGSHTLSPLLLTFGSVRQIAGGSCPPLEINPALLGFWVPACAAPEPVPW